MEKKKKIYINKTRGKQGIGGETNPFIYFQDIKRL